MPGYVKVLTNQVVIDLLKDQCILMSARFKVSLLTKRIVPPIMGQVTRQVRIPNRLMHISTSYEKSINGLECS